jgi:hypothetical protein
MVALLDRGKECVEVGVQDRRLTQNERMFSYPRPLPRGAG